MKRIFIDPVSESVIEKLSKNSMTFDDLYSCVTFPRSEIDEKLTDLLLDGLIEKEGGRFYVSKN